MLSRVSRAAFDLKSGLAQSAVRAASRRMRAAESASPEQVERDSRQAAMALARHAWDTTEFYPRRYAEAGITRADLEQESTFDSLPVIEKDEIRDQRDAFISRGSRPGDRLPSSTGGSTGQPLTVFHDRRAPVAAMWWRVYRWWGIHPADDKAFVQRDRRSSRQRTREVLEWWPTRHATLDAMTLTEESMSAFTAGLAGRSTPLVNGYVGGVHEYALYLESVGGRIPGLRAVGVTAAPLTPSQRIDIERALGAPVHDQYRSAEVPWLAAECGERDGLHVLADLRRLELVDDTSSPVSQGEVVVTDLTNRVFPLVRYRLGDRTSWAPGTCACGMTLPRIQPVDGRVSDVLELPDGQRISGGLTGLFNARPDAVRQFQIRQRVDLSLRLLWIRGPAADAEAVVGDAVDRLRQISGSQVDVAAEEVDVIGHDGGKARVIVREGPA